MINFEAITIEDKRWNDIVTGFRDYDVYYLSGYVKAFMLHGDGTPVLIYYNDGNSKGINVVMIRDIAQDPRFEGSLELGVYYDIATPYGYGGFLIEGTIPDSFVKDYVEFCQTKNIISEFVRFNPMTRNHEKVEGLYDIQILGETISMDLRSKDTIRNNLTSQNRNKITKAIRNGLSIHHGINEELLKKFSSLYNITMNRLGAKDYYYFGKEFYGSIMNDLPENAVIFYAEKDAEIVAMSIILIANDRMHYHLTAYKPEMRIYAPINLLIYEIANWGSDNGYKYLHLGGGLGSSNDDLYKFKSSFNRNSSLQFAVGKVIFNHEAYQRLVDIRANDTDFNAATEYFPLYRG